MKCADCDAPARFMSAPEYSRGVDTTPLPRCTRHARPGSPRYRNPRRVLVEGMKRVNAQLGIVRARWDISMTVHDGATWRKRHDDEKPENRAGYWEDAFVRLGEMIDELAELRELAKTNYQALTKETLR